MLKSMRDSFHKLKWILIAVVAAFVFGFVFLDMGLGRTGGGGQKDTGYAARVNGETITYNDYYRSLKNYEDMYRQMYGQQFTPEMVQAMGLPRQVLDALVDQRLLTQQANRLHMSATPEEIRHKLLTIPTFSPDGKFVGMELYNRYVTGPLGYASAAEFEEALGREIELGKIESALTNSVVVSSKAAEDEYRRVSENAKIKYVLYPATRELANVTVTPAEVETYYRANQPKYQHGEQRKVRYLLADAARLRSQIIPSDADLRKRYEANKQEYKRQESAHVLHILVKVEPGAAPAVDAAAKAKADSLVAQLRKGADFASLARTNSEDPSSSAKGGDMGFVDRGITVEPFEQAIFSISLNTISDPIRTQEFGYHIVKVLERRPAGYRSFEEVRPELAARVADETAKEQATNEINRVSAQLRNKKPASATEFVAYANDKVSSNDTGWFAKADPIPGIGNNPPLTDWVFTAAAGDVGQVTGTSRGPALPMLESVRPAGVSPLADIRDKVEQDAKQAKAREMARKNLQAAVAGASSIDAVSQKTAIPTAEVSVNRQGFVAGFTGDVSTLIDMAMSAPVGQLEGPIEVGDGAVAFQVVEQKKVDPADLAKNRDQYVDTLRQAQVRSLRTVLLQRLKKDSKIQINETILRPQTTDTNAGV
jgi:peptidyl-prolyl cis-trans isomerase D